MDEARMNPEDFLRQIQREAQAQGRGHLKIFFGYAAGVGKTYSMLKAAHGAKEQGIDVVVGYVEPHPRPDTAALLDGLESIPPKEVAYKGISLFEFDLDAALARRPQLVLVDEFAHTNAQQCRHEKRYQDIQELLKSGIDVYTTVNVQHLESLNDQVTAITGVTVRERIPDSVFDKADQVELVDIEPDELLQRLSAGKIYRKEQAQRAIGHFFDLKNLTALREIALRRCADRVNKLSDHVASTADSGYYTDEHILVCLSSSPTNAKIIRTAARMADAFKGNFTALFVETPGFMEMSEQDKNRLRENIRLAEQLGASIETVYGEDVAFQIAEFARLSRVSKIVIGRMSAKRRLFFGKPSLTEQLIAAAPNLDIHVIPDQNAKAYPHRTARFSPPRFTLADVGKSLLILLLSTCIGFFFWKLGFSEANIITVYILGVLVTAVVTSKRVYSLIASLVSVLTFNFFFTTPRFTFNAYDDGYPITFLIMFLAALLTGSLATKIKTHAKQTAQIAYRTKILLETNQLLQKGKGQQEIVKVTATQLMKLLQKDIVFYLAKEERLEPPLVFLVDGHAGDEYLSENEKAVAAWVQRNNKHAGATTQTLGGAKCLYLSVRVGDSVYGVVGIGITSEPLSAFENSILLSILGECALALENHRILKEREQAAILAKNEQLRANLLRSISHDLRTPLTSISGNAGILFANEDAIEPQKRKQLYGDIYDDALWLINLVENLLSVTRIEDGTMRLNLRAELLDEIITEALHHVGRHGKEHTITVEQEDEFLLAKMDARLIVQVILNIVDNAMKYTPVGSQITISTQKAGDKIMVSIADNGDGISNESKEKIFEMFYTANTKIADSKRSLGLGLALCKSIILAHGGEISVSDNFPKGTVFSFTLPAEEVTLHE